MKKGYIAFAALCAAALASCTCPSAGEQRLRPSEYVSTLVGTQSDFSLSTGNTYPAIALPWGMNFWTPQTGKMGDGWAYTYGAHQVRGFKQTHQPSPWINDYGQFSLMPVRGEDKFDEESRASWFSHQSEVAKPYYYKTYLADHDIRVEITPTDRAAMMRFTFPDSKESGVVIDAFDRGSQVGMVDDRTIVGYTTRNSGGVPENFRNWFVVRFDTPFSAIELTDAPGGYKPGSNLLYPEGQKSVTGEHAVAKVHFATRRGQQICASVASSFISPEQALQNLRELGSDDFETVKSKAQARWDDVLGRIEVEGGTDDQYRTFYSCLYRSVLFPRKFYEVTDQGEVVHYSPYNGEVLPGYMYTDTGFWDTFRSLFPLLNLVYPSVNAEIQQGLANAARESGFLPEWASPGHRGCMVGNNSASVVADAVVKGTNDKDLGVLYDAMVYATEHVHPTVASTGRWGHEYYNELGYIPYDVNIPENVARTLEYAYDDWCILQVAKKLNRPQAELDKWAARARNYRNVFDPETRLMRGRLRDGKFQAPFSPYKWGDAFTEGNSWHYTWSVFHDVEGLVGCFGGREEMLGKLDSLFTVSSVVEGAETSPDISGLIGQYAHGNEPSHHVLYLYTMLGQPWKTADKVREVLTTLYRAEPDGLSGNEDVGQMSAWYVLSSLGMYEVEPAGGRYWFGSPLFDRAEVKVPGGTFAVVAENNSAENKYIQRIWLNGQPYTKPWIGHADMMKGGELRFEMGAEPKVWYCPDEPETYADQRPAEEKRLFRSEAVEQEIARVCGLLTNERLRWMFANCFPNTLDTTVHYGEDTAGNPDTYVYTGDIAAMWLRDSGAQVWPYVQLCGKDAQLQRMIAGVIRRQMKLINIDPYANAFNVAPTGVHNETDFPEADPMVFERKWEILSLIHISEPPRP